MNEQSFRAVPLFLAFAFALCAQPPQPGPGVPQSLAAIEAQLAALTAQVNAQQTTIATLQAAIAKLNGQITMADLAGTYAYVGIQDELGLAYPGRPAYVGSYVYTGTVTLNAEGTGSGTVGQSGNYLNFLGSLSSADVPAGTGTLTWTHSNGVVTITLTSGPNTGDQASLNVAAGGRVMTFVSAKHVACPDKSCGIDELAILTRLE